MIWLVLMGRVNDKNETHLKMMEAESSIHLLLTKGLCSTANRRTSVSGVFLTDKQTSTGKHFTFELPTRWIQCLDEALNLWSFWRRSKWLKNLLDDVWYPRDESDNVPKNKSRNHQLKRLRSQFALLFVCSNYHIFLKDNIVSEQLKKGALVISVVFRNQGSLFIPFGVELIHQQTLHSLIPMDSYKHALPQMVGDLNGWFVCHDGQFL